MGSELNCLLRQQRQFLQALGHRGKSFLEFLEFRCQPPGFFDLHHLVMHISTSIPFFVILCIFLGDLIFSLIAFLLNILFLPFLISGSLDSSSVLFLPPTSFPSSCSEKIKGTISFTLHFTPFPPGFLFCLLVIFHWVTWIVQSCSGLNTDNLRSFRIFFFPVIPRETKIQAVEHS